MKDHPASVIKSSTGVGGDKSEVLPSNEANEGVIEQPVSDRFTGHRFAVKLHLRCRNAELGKDVNDADEQMSSMHKVVINPWKGI